MPNSKNPTVVLLGNTAPMMQVDQRDGDGNVTGRVGVPARHINQSVTRVEMWDGFDDPDFVNLTLSTDNDRILTMIARGLDDAHKQYAVGLGELEQILAIHSGHGKWGYVACENKGFAEAISQHFGAPIGEPTNLLTTVGRDAIHAQHLSTSAQPASFFYMALTASTTAPAASDTTLAGEITTAGGGLVRAATTYAHTAGTNTSTLTKTFTANGSDSLPVTLAQIGVFNAASAGILGYHTALNATATLTIAGDNVAVTESLQIG